MTSSIKSKVDTVISCLRKIKTRDESIVESDRCFSLPDDYLCIHVLGSDETECESIEPQYLMGHYSALFDEVLGLSISKLGLIFIGPNLDVRLDGASDSFLYESGGQQLAVETKVFAHYYHELPPSNFDEMSFLPHVVSIFNGGIWGYSSWQPTLLALRQLFCRRKFVCLVTSYTMEEAEDDFDTIEAWYHGSELEISPIWLWECEVNPQHCTAPVQRATNPRPHTHYFENFAWSCFSFK